MDIDPETQLHIEKKHKEERKASDERYAIKLVEKIVFYMVAAMGIAVLGAVLKLVIL